MEPGFLKRQKNNNVTSTIMETEKRIIGRCPLCGSSVVKTCKGYRCEHNIGERPSCVLNINGIIGNRKMNDAEITELLELSLIHI